jgi:hypothetical protein
MLMRVSPEFIQKLEAWCASQPDRPSKTEAIRRFVEAGIKATGKAA